VTDTSLDPQLLDVQQRKQEDAMRATIARLTRELAEAEADRDKALNRCADGVHVEEYNRVRTELSEALAGRDREYNRAEAEREKANEWLGQLTDAKKQISAACQILGAVPGESVFDAAYRCVSTAATPRPSRSFKPEKGTLADVFTRVHPKAKKPTKPVGRVISKTKKAGK
jgi:hypothetical protein